MGQRTGSKLEEIDLQISELRTAIATGTANSQTAQIDLTLLLEERANILADIAWQEFDSQTSISG